MAETKSFPNSGALFARQKKSANAPDAGGEIEISGDVLEYVIAEGRSGRPVKLELSGWRRIGAKNVSFTSLKVAIPYQRRAEPMSDNGPRRAAAEPAPREDWRDRDQKQANEKLPWE